MKVLVSVKLSEHKFKTPEGYLLCKDAIIARTGKQQYMKSEIYADCDDSDIIEVERTEEEVFSPATLASFEDKPITCEHPNENVGPENYSELAVGHTKNVRKGDAKVDGEYVMLADLLITDAAIIEDIENGIRTDLSCGYDCDITEGDHPKQINIRGNHVALCEEGRAGIARIIDSSSQEIGTFWRNLAKKNNLNSSEMDKIYKAFTKTPVFINWDKKNDMDIMYSVEMFKEFEKYFKLKTGNKLIIDSNPISKNSITDAISKGMLIQEFGKNGNQYKVIKVDKNTIYAEDMINEKLTLFRKDKQSVEWDIINKTDIYDNKTIGDKKMKLLKDSKTWTVMVFTDEDANLINNASKFNCEVETYNKNVKFITGQTENILELLNKFGTYGQWSEEDLESISNEPMTRIKSNDSISSSAKSDIESKLKNVDYKSIKEIKISDDDKNIAKYEIKFDTSKALNKAADILKSAYDIEIIVEDKVIKVYDKLKKDSKKKLKDSKLSDTEFSRKFYVKMIDLLNKKKDELKSNTTLDEFNMPYRAQQHKAIKEINNQLLSYKQKLKELDKGV